MIKMNKREIENLNVGDKVYAKTKLTKNGNGIIIQEYVVVNKDKGVYSLIETALFERMIMTTSYYIPTSQLIDGIIKYDINKDSDVELMIDYKKALEKDLAKGKTLIQDFLIENTHRMNVEVTFLSQFGTIAKSIVDKIEDVLIGKKAYRDGLIITLESDVIDNMLVTYDSKNRNWEIKIECDELQEETTDEEEICSKCGEYEDDCYCWYEDYEYVDVTPEYAKENMFNEDILFSVEHPLHDEIIERGLACEEDCPEMYRQLEWYVEEELHTYMDILNILTFYATTSEIKEILEKGKFKALRFCKDR